MKYIIVSVLAIALLMVDHIKSDITVTTYKVIGTPICIGRHSRVVCRAKLVNMVQPTISYTLNVERLILKGETMTKTCGTTMFSNRYVCGVMR